jgi:hypothetical protein
MSLPGMPPSNPCATVWQAITYLLLPAALAAGAVWVTRRLTDRKGVRVAVVSTAVVVCLLWETLAVGLLAGFLAPCSSSCWY